MQRNPPKHVFRYYGGKVFSDTRSQARAQIKRELGISSHGRLPVNFHIEQVK